MAKIVKSDREVPDIDLELAKVSKKDKKKAESKDINKKTKEKNNKKEKTKKTGYFKEVRKEVSKVVWPSRKNMVKYSIAVISFIIFFAIFFYVIELIMALLKVGV